jgi:hypothetical protein
MEKKYFYRILYKLIYVSRLIGAPDSQKSVFSGSTLRAASQSVALLQASHELRIGDGEHAVLPLSGDKLVADFIAIPGSALRNRLLGDSARPMRLRPDRRHSLPAPARGFASAKAGGDDECTEAKSLIPRSHIARRQSKLNESGSHPTLRWREKDSNPRSPVRETFFLKSAH